jgi:predicted glycoside hydrolase/deacetylase ChbG (UPF0249 family)
METVARLIVNADDFGYTRGVNRAVLELSAAGALHSTTLMAAGSAFEDAVEQAGRSRLLGIGCHVVLVDGSPILPVDQVRTLLDPGSIEAETPRFRPSLAHFARDLFLGRINTREIEAEASAQIEKLQAAGIRVTHLDTHKHTHMFPRVLRPLLRAALGRGVRAIRNPFEPAWSRRATTRAPVVRALEVRALTLFRREFLRATAQGGGISTTSGALGVLATGTLDAATLRRLLEALSRRDDEATWELVCHPGYADPELAAQPTRLVAAREVERSALVEILSGASGIEQIHYGEL